MRIALASVALAAAVALSGCAATTQLPETPGAGRRTVYVVHHGTLHTGLTMRRSNIPRGHWPASADFGRSKYIEVGWGDDDGYRKPLTSGIAMKALLGDPQTVLFAEGFSQPIQRRYRDPNFTVLAVDLSDAGIIRLCDYIQRTYAVDRKGEPVRLGNGWYRAQGTYSAFNTCNTWIARGLRKAGCPIDDTLCLTAGQLLGRVRPFARDISTKR
ncbi:MAG TPA: DUF2459 domain-containing protein [Chthoniobacterales bacterium]|nr:DUF2459 domain-containing protein [Chthoniobacterales bacterium]